MMARNESGFTMVELIITMVIFVFAMAAITKVFVPLLSQYKQQSKISESQAEGLVGLDLFRRDIEHAGFGLPWVLDAGVSYNEATTAPANTYNDCSGAAPCNSPKAIVSGNDIASLGGSDYLIVKATAVDVNNASQKWTYVVGTIGKVKQWGTPTEDLNPGDWVTVLNPVAGESENAQRILIDNAGTYGVPLAANFPAAYVFPGENHLIYGISDDTTLGGLRMPFNRADYYINRPGTEKCAAGTGTLVKAIMSQRDGSLTGNVMPLIDCVADIQVVYALQPDPNNPALTYVADVTALTAQGVRNQVKEVHISILAHEGKRDPAFTFTNFTAGACSTCVTVGEFGLGRDYNLSTIADYSNYRWKVYTMVIKPKNLRG